MAFFLTIRASKSKTMKNIFTVFCFIILGVKNTTLAQTSKDTLPFLTANWKITALHNGLTWKHCHFKQKELFNSNQNIHIIEAKQPSFWRRRYPSVSFVSDGDSLELTSVLAKNNNALVGVNGSFFDVKKGGAVDFIKINNQIIDTTRHNGKRLAEHQMSALVIKNGKISIEHTRDSVDFRWETRINAPNVMVTGPLLIFDEKPYPLSKSAFNDNRHPRTCACVTQKNELILLTADGRTAEAQGLNLPELTQLLLKLKCKSAVNLDGGGSTALYVSPASIPSLEIKEGSGIVNMPCDNKKFDHEGERKVSNILILKKK
jgi:exopolysaccharide biosynthesis protein